METVFLISDLSANVLEAVLHVLFVFAFLRKKEKYRKNVLPQVLSVFCYFVLVTLCSFFVTFDGVAIALYIAFLFAVAMLFTDGTVGEKLFASIVPLNITSASSLLTISSVSAILNRPVMDYLMTGAFWYLFVMILHHTVMALVLLLLLRIMQKNAPSLVSGEWYILSADLVLSIAAYTVIFYNMLASDTVGQNLLSALGAAFIIVLNLTGYVMMVRFSHRAQVEQENALLRAQRDFQNRLIDDAKSQFETERKYVHDIRNIMGMIDSLNEEDRREEITELIQNYLTETDKKASGLLDTKNASVNAILNLKVSEAEQEGIAVTVQTTTLDGISCTYDLCILIGNLFDNAIRGTVGCKSRLIDAVILQDRDQLKIHVSNSIPHSVLQTNPTLKSDQPPTGQHGYGTKIIRQIASRHYGFADFYEDEAGFHCIVELN